MMRFIQILFFLIIQSCSLFSYESTPYGNNGGNDSPRIEIRGDYDHNMQKSNNWRFSANATVIPDYAGKKVSIDYSHASPQLKHFFSIVTSLMYFSTVADHYCALPGYVFPEGLRYCINGLSEFKSSDIRLISHLTDRLKTYCTRIENILYDNKHNVFRDTISRKDQIALINVYADFLKEFYGKAGAQYVFDYYAQSNPLMQQVRSDIKWCHYDDKTNKSSTRDQQLKNVASLNGNLGGVHKALQEGNSEQAHIIGYERVKTVVPGRWFGKTEHISSVFERYPTLHKRVEQAYLANQTRLEQERLAQQAHVQNGVGIIKAEFKEGISIKSLCDRLQKRYDAVTYHLNNPEFFKKVYALAAEQSARISPCHLTPDQKGILFEGGHYQHHLVNESVSVIDTVISGDLVENMQDAVIDLANTSIELNKQGNVVMTTRALDTCWALIECAHNAAQCVYTGMLNNMHPIKRGMWNGFVDSMSGVVHAVVHPVKTVQETAQSLAVAGYCLGKLAYASCVYDAACDVLESDPKRYEEMIAQYSIDPEAFKAIYEHAKNTSVEDIARFGTKTVIDTMLLRDVTKIVSAFAKEQWASLVSCMRKAGQSTEAVAATAEGISAKCGEEIASIVHKMESTQKASGAALEKEIFSTSDKINCIEIKNPVLDNIRTGSALKKDPFHDFDPIIDNFARYAKKFDLEGRDKILKELYQIEGSLNGKDGIFEWIVDPRVDRGVTHRIFIKNGTITGKPNVY